MTDRTTDTPETASHRHPSSRRRSTASRRGRRSSWGPSLAIGLAAVLLVAVVADAFASAGRVHPGVTVGGVAVGGLSPIAAQNMLAEKLAAKTADPVTVTYKTKKWTVKADDIGLSFDYPKLAAAAMAVGRTGGFFGVVGGRAGAWVGAAKLEATPTADPAKLAATLDRIAAGTDVKPTDASLEIKGVKVSVTSSAEGLALQRDELASSLLWAFMSTSRTVAAPVSASRPKISDAAAASAKSVVTTMIAVPAAVTYGKKTWTFSPAELARMIALRAVEPSGAPAGSTQAAVLEPYISAVEASKTIAPKLGVALGRPPRDAKFKTSNGSVVVVPSQQGIGPDIDALALNLTQTLKADPSIARSVELRTRVADPKFTTAQANAMGIRQRISTFTTSYSSGNTPRVNNVHTLGHALDGKLVAPGATFSFNGAVGERTAAKGYQEANAIVDGKLVPQLGGGICQVGTTMFNAVFFSGLPVIERSPHSFYIGHYPKGRDATVSWGGPDLKWKNDTPNWVLVSVSYTDSSITISLYGTNPGYSVDYTTGPFTNETPFTTDTIPDPTLPVGLKVVSDSGETGRRCVVTRKVSKGGQLIRTDTFVSVYRPKVETVRVGTKAKSSKPTTGTPTPKPKG